MATIRCLVIPLDMAEAPAAIVHEALARIPDFRCRLAGDEECGFADVDAVVFIASRGSMARLLERLAPLRERRPECAVVVAGGGFDEREVLALFEAGAHDFVSDPRAAEELRARVRHALGLVAPGAPPRLREALRLPMRDFIGQSPALLKQVGKLPTIAGCDAGVLILGETGTGKEVCAQAIHYMSARASKPWIAVNCGAIPVELIESELFGHVRGAYTTAHAAREGLVAEAEGGTLFLDDIDCLPLSAQSKLLRFLQEREYRMVGANAVRRADVRVIAACNRDLAVLVARGDFRQDLYFRLNVLALSLPPLRERREDIAALALHFLGVLAHKHGRRVPSLSPQALKRLFAHEWPGNVRELQHVMERTLLLAKGPVIGAEEVEIGGLDAGIPADESFQAAKDRVVQNFERTYIEQLLITFEGNVTHAAREAKKNRRAFFELIRKHRIEVQRFRATK